MFNKKKVFTDFTYNLISSIIPILLLQILIYPIINQKIGNEEYGMMITIVALFSLLSSPFGNVLNNVRLLSTNENKNETSYLYILILLNILNVLIVSLVLIFAYHVIQPIIIIIISFISILLLSRQFFLVYFRISLDYKNIFLSNLVLGLGYLTGFSIVVFTNFWYWVYIAGLLTSILFIIYKIKKNKEYHFDLSKININDIKYLLKDVAILVVAGLLVSSITYFDRILLFPLLGALAVSIYYASSIFGKIISQLINPMSNVILSHLASFKKFNKVFFIKYLFLVISLSCVIIIGVNIFGPIFLKLLYPNLFDLAKNYIIFGAINSALIVLYSALNPFLLKFFYYKWQILVNLLTFILYLTLCFIFSKNFGFKGFYVGIIISNAFRFIFIVTIIMIAKKKVINYTESTLI